MTVDSEEWREIGEPNHGLPPIIEWRWVMVMRVMFTCAGCLVLACLAAAVERVLFVPLLTAAIVGAGLRRLSDAARVASEGVLAVLAVVSVLALHESRFWLQCAIVHARVGEHLAVGRVGYVAALLEQGLPLLQIGNCRTLEIASTWAWVHFGGEPLLVFIFACRRRIPLCQTCGGHLEVRLSALSKPSDPGSLLESHGVNPLPPITPATRRADAVRVLQLSCCRCRRSEVQVALVCLAPRVRSRLVARSMDSPQSIR